MNIKDMKIEEFINKLSSSSPTPGGGSSAAFVSAIGICLANMSLNLSIGKQKHEKNEELIKKLLEKGLYLKNNFQKLIEDDINIYKKVRDSYKMPKNTLEEKNIRNISIQYYLKEAVIVPFNIIQMSLESLILIEECLDKINLNLISDLASSAINLKAGAQSAWLNILINIKSITDENFCEKYKKEGENILKDISIKSDTIYLKLLKLL